MEQYNVIIVGAGLAGLMAAKHLKEANIDYIVLEKEKIVGGRMATFISETGCADYGAQFFTTRSETMKTLAKQWQEENIVKKWTNGFPKMKSVDDLESLVIYQDGYPRYAGLHGMNPIAQKLAEGLNIRVRHCVENLSVDDGKWKVAVQKNSQETAFFYGDKLILTCPVPLSLKLLETSNIKIDENTEAMLRQTSYFPCLTGILTLDKKTNIPSPGGIQIAEGMVAFISDNAQKGISETTTVTIHGGDVWSREHEHLADEEILSLFIAGTRPLLGDGIILEKRLIRWKYSKPENLHPDEFAYSLVPLLVVFAGDIFRRGAVEGAILSGLAASRWVIGGGGK